MTNITYGKVKKTRSSRACENCRARKIKCSGNQPCSNCEIYNCPCAFTPIKRKNLSDKGIERIANNDHLFQENNASTTTNIRSDFESTNDANKPASSSEVSPIDSDESELMKFSVIPDNNDDYYISDLEKQKTFITFETMLQQLRSVRSSEDLVNNVKSNIQRQIQTLLDNWAPQVDFPKLDGKLNDGSTNEGNCESVETLLMKNKYRERLRLARFTVWSDRQNDKDRSGPSSFPQAAIADHRARIFCPINMSLKGIAFLLKKYILDAKDSRNVTLLKETVYFLLRLFDLSASYDKKYLTFMKDPLIFLLQKNCITLESTNPFSRNHLVARTIRSLPQLFVDTVLKRPVDDLISFIDDDSAMFKILVNLYTIHRNHLGNFLLDYDYSTPPSIQQNKEFRDHCDTEDMLAALCTNYYNALLYRTEDDDRFEYLELLSELVHQSVILQRWYYVKHLLGNAIPTAIEIGLPRWEYYVGLDENTAERRRNLWWKLYCQEKSFSFRFGTISSIDDNYMNCLLPNEFRKIGILYNKDFVANFSNIPVEAFDKMTVSSLKLYGECALLQFISVFQRKNILSDEYTSILNTGKHPLLRKKLLDKFITEFKDIYEIKEMIQTHTRRLFHIAGQSPSTAGVSKAEWKEAADFVLFQNQTISSMLGSAAQVVARLTEVQKEDPVSCQLEESSSYLYQMWNEMNSILLKLEDDYDVHNALVYYSVVAIMVVAKGFDILGTFLSLDDLIGVLRIFKRLDNISFFKNNENDSVKGTRFYEDFQKGYFTMSLISRVLFISYMDEKGIDSQYLIDLLKIKAPDIGDLPYLLLDTRSYIFEYIRQPIKKSGFNLEVREMLEHASSLKKVNNPHFELSNRKETKPDERHIDVDKVGLNQNNTDESSSKTKLSPFSPITSQLDGSGQAMDTQSGVRDSLESSFGIKENKSSLSGTLTNQDIDINWKSDLNIGTLDDFINNTDLNSLYSQLWNNDDLDVLF
ncbi:Zn(II)2Cys6 transcription factor NDAI_0A03410 [Naumovozyma dairenensis CBS 421]|uniref:Zn(2)-C6 fungal-type domain-containing protein n=1 Tax=Naumovozyma dairenensis (strain ATCC 10597 / BCRC 20456 / CBS 421 / NBRC 0211 / NRRL Y-12639) TaxID=1071378 RepID=G0W3W0_NAUDC|nr:hypothetical protein NDAI_0A03410 [Naumovozyma dairenensis CBS 421]CCD22498.1 hypothetical protein NDAI_0A03410 [Naumovozyma dairenensis CBS 421]